MAKYSEDETTQFLKKLEEVCFVLYMAKKTITEQEFEKQTSTLLKLVKDFRKDKY